MYTAIPPPHSPSPLSLWPHSLHPRLFSCLCFHEPLSPLILNLNVNKLAPIKWNRGPPINRMIGRDCKTLLDREPLVIKHTSRSVRVRSRLKNTRLCRPLSYAPLKKGAPEHEMLFHIINTKAGRRYITVNSGKATTHGKYSYGISFNSITQNPNILHKHW